MKSLHLDLRP